MDPIKESKEAVLGINETIVAQQRLLQEALEALKDARILLEHKNKIIESYRKTILAHQQ